MKTNILLIALLLLACASFSQSVQKKVKDKTNQRVDSKVDQGIDKGLNKAEDAIGNLFKKKKKKAKDTTGVTGKTPDGMATGGAASGGSIPKAGEAFSDFQPGANIIFADQFEQDALSDFPAQWNTNGSGTIVTIDGLPGKWLDIAHNSVVNPVMDNPLPENCTIEFDLFLQSAGEQSVPLIQFGLTPVRDLLKEDLWYKNRFFTSIARYNEQNGRAIEYGLSQVIGNKNDFNLLAYTNKVLHVSMAINKTRIRVYFDKTKLIDLPRALTPELRNNFFIANTYVIPAAELGVLVSNLRIASADTDARSLLIKQLMEEGKAVTNDILFDVNSDVIKAESYGVVNQIGEALKTNPSLKIRITGHTDAVGTADKNLVLSQKRAAAVKKYLAVNYGIADNRIATDGKGASMPVAPNTTVEGKAKNRRVEFTKL